MISLVNGARRSLKMSKKELMEVEDKDLRRYMVYQNAHNEYRHFKIDNDEKIGYYLTDERVAINKQDVVYKKGALMEYIVYRKATGKVVMSKQLGNVFLDMLKEHFYYPDFVLSMCLKPSSTLCKKIIEGKVSTVRDIVSYYKSYVVKDKSISLDTTHKFMVLGHLNYISGAEDPENIKHDTPLYKVNPQGLTNNFKVKYRIEEVDKHDKRVEDWEREQNNKLAAFLRQRNAEASSKDVNNLPW